MVAAIRTVGRSHIKVHTDKSDVHFQFALNTSITSNVPVLAASELREVYIVSATGCISLTWPFHGGALELRSLRLRSPNCKPIVPYFTCPQGRKPESSLPACLLGSFIGRCMIARHRQSNLDFTSRCVPVPVFKCFLLHTMLTMNLNDIMSNTHNILKYRYKL